MSDKKSLERMQQLIEAKRKKSAEQGFWKKKKDQTKHPAEKK